MANLTSKELSALEDQLGFEQMSICKYKAAAQETTETALKTCYERFAGQHQQNFNNLLNYLK
ncbi:MAG: spore coat protein [Oscillospiraceae bacterium]|nr:spore coat protein [Oscillospiraceae bacterium]